MTLSDEAVANGVATAFRAILAEWPMEANRVVLFTDHEGREHKAEAHELRAALEASGLVDQSELLAALHQYRSDLMYPPSPDSRERRLAMIDKLIAGATR